LITQLSGKIVNDAHTEVEEAELRGHIAVLVGDACHLARVEGVPFLLLLEEGAQTAVAHIAAAAGAEAPFLQMMGGVDVVDYILGLALVDLASEPFRQMEVRGAACVHPASVGEA